MNPLNLLLGWKGYVAAALAGCLMASTATWRVMSWREQAHEAKFAVQQIKLTDQAIKINVDIGDVVVKGVELVQVDHIRIVREIEQHVTPEIDRAYPVPVGFVRVWNDASGAPIPPATSGSDADDSGAKLSEVANAHADDAASIKTCQTYLTAWWDWYDRMAARK